MRYCAEFLVLCFLGIVWSLSEVEHHGSYKQIHKDSIG